MNPLPKRWSLLFRQVVLNRRILSRKEQTILFGFYEGYCNNYSFYKKMVLASTQKLTFNYFVFKELTIKDFIPPSPAKSFRITLELEYPEKRLDSILLAALKEQTENPGLSKISRAKFKTLFSEGKIMIKGQRAKPTSSLAMGTTYVDILGY